MSRSNNIEIKNPAKFLIEWGGSNGTLSYYDKSVEADDKNVNVPIPFTFLVLDILSTVKGYSSSAKSGFWSNEVRSIKDDILIVRTKEGEVKRGKYREVIDTKECRGAKFCQSVYVAIKSDTGVLEIAKIQFTGAALNAWIDFRKKNDIYKGAVQITGSKQEQNGATVYYMPVFKSVPVSDETNKSANTLDVTLQEYLAKYLNKSHSAPVESSSQEKNEIPDDFEDVPFSDEAPPETDNSPF